MVHDASKQAQIHALWDALVEFPAACAEEALVFLMQGLCALLDAQNGIYFGTVRFAKKGQSRDPVKRWRVQNATYLHPSDALDQAAREQLGNYQRGEFDLLDIQNVAQAGTFRVNRLVDLVPPEWFKTPFYLRHYQSLGHADAMWAGAPVSADAEVFCGIFRSAAHPAFTPAERELFAQALRSLKWFHRQVLLNRGVMVADAPLTDMEQQVLQGLLGGQPEKVIADQLGQSYHTAHAHIRAIFRKFGVRNRPSLMALWLGQI